MDIKIVYLIVPICSFFSMAHEALNAQNSCNDYYEILDNSVSRLFTSEMNRIVREDEFPSIVHDYVSETQISHLELPSEQWICDGVLNAIYKNNPVKEPPTHYALYKVKDFYFMVIYKYFTASDGTQLIEEPTVGGLFDPQFNRVGVVFL